MMYRWFMNIQLPDLENLRMYLTNIDSMSKVGGVAVEPVFGCGGPGDDASLSCER